MIAAINTTAKNIYNIKGLLVLFNMEGRPFIIPFYIIKKESPVLIIK